MPAGAGWVACRRQPVGRHERERRRQPERSGAPSQRGEQQAGVSPDLFSFLTESKRSGERLPKAAQRVNAVNQFAGFLGLTGRSRCQQTEFFDNRAPGQVRDRLTEGWPEGRAERERTSQLTRCHAGAFVARMWLSKKANFHKRACVRFVF